MGSLFRPRFLASSLAAVTLATHAYGQESDLQQAIQRHLAKQGPVMEAPRTVMADLDGNGTAEAVVSHCINGSASTGKNNPVKCIVQSVSLSRRTDVGWEPAKRN